jgi:hypothetical protein
MEAAGIYKLHSDWLKIFRKWRVLHKEIERQTIVNIATLCCIFIYLEVEIFLWV